MHMVQHHLLLADLAAILFILGFTKVILRPATRRLLQVEHAVGPFAHPAFGAIGYVTVMLVCTSPRSTTRPCATPASNALEHICFASAGFLYWWHLLSPIRSRLPSRLGPGALHGLHEDLSRPAGDRHHVRSHRSLRVLRSSGVSGV